MALVRLIYTSKKAADIDMPDILRIMDVAQVTNKECSITGILCFNETDFLQALEGDSFLVNQLYNKILNDDRHSDVCLIDFSFVSERVFPDWSMGYVDVNKISSKGVSTRIKNTLPQNNFNPTAMDGVQSLWLLKEFSKTLNR